MCSSGGSRRVGRGRVTTLVAHLRPSWPVTGPMWPCQEQVGDLTRRDDAWDQPAGVISVLVAPREYGEPRRLRARNDRPSRCFYLRGRLEETSRSANPGYPRWRDPVHRSEGHLDWTPMQKAVHLRTTRCRERSELRRQCQCIDWI